MAQPNDGLNAALQSPFATPVYYLASTEAALVQEAAQKCVQALEREQDIDITRVDGPVPDMAEVIAAAGAISFFGTPRVVVLHALSPSTMGDKDVDELCTLFGELENAVLVISAVYKDKKTATGKKAKKLLEAAKKAGFAAEWGKPTRSDNIRFLQECAAQVGASYEPGAADLLLERAGEDRSLLAAETLKLAALCGYKSISQRAVLVLGTQNIEADVFELARLITGRRAGETYAKLNDLLALRHEPIAIAAALSGTYIDMLRVRYGKEAKKGTGEVFKELGYKGNDYRLKKAGDTAAKYSTAQLEDCVLILADLDLKLKSSALADKSILLQAAVGQLLQQGARK